MNRLWKSTIIVFLFFVGTAFLFISHADRGDKLVASVARNNGHPKKVPAEGEHGMVGLPINGEVRTKRVPVGLWGGDHISMEVTERRTTVEYDCANGTIDQRIALDRRGRFDVSGIHAPEHGGPVRQNELLNGYPVQFTGRISGKRMYLTVKRRDNGELIGTFTLVHGVEPRLMKCR